MVLIELSMARGAVEHSVTELDKMDGIETAARDLIFIIELDNHTPMGVPYTHHTHIYTANIDSTTTSILSSTLLYSYTINGRD